MNNRNRALHLLTACLLLWLAAPSGAFAQTADREALRQCIESLSSASEPAIDGEPIAATTLIPALYQHRGYELAWTDAMKRELLDHVLRSVDYGLDPVDFHAARLGSRINPGSRDSDPSFRAHTEILFTDALARLAVTLKYGKLDPSGLDPAWNFSRSLEMKDPVGGINAVLTSGSITPFLDSMDPKSPLYDWLRQALVTYRGIMGRGGWPTVPKGPVLELESVGQRVVTLRQRLRISGDLTAVDPADPAVLDSDLESAVKRFQVRHGIDADGRVGPRSLEELNIPVEDRINQIRATLERVRWVFRDITGDHIVVDLAGFQLYLFQGGEQTWKTRVQVGKPFHATPVFKDTVRYLEFNPTWTIPPGITRNETLPAIRRDPSYLSRNNMIVVTNNGIKVDPSTIDWAATAQKGFPYMIRQEPGPGNALGRVKFMFPNPYMVYLHDTPSKGLFARSERAFSHGCIRTQNPFELAELLVADQGWDRARIDQVLASMKTTRVNLENPMPVLLLYWTAEADAEGTVHFRKDFYGRDAAIIEGLNQPFRVSAPAGTREAMSGR